MQTLVIVVTILGALVSLWGILRAHGSARAEARAADQRLVDEKVLNAELAREQEIRGQMSEEETTAFHAKWDAAFAQKGIVRATWGNIARLPMLQEQMNRSGKSGWLDLTLSIGGLLVATGASVWSFFISA